LTQPAHGPFQAVDVVSLLGPRYHGSVTTMTPDAIQPPSSASRTVRPVVVPDTLAALAGPGSGTVTLPRRLCWSLENPRFDVVDRDAVLDMYEAVLDAGTLEDFTGYLNAGILVSVWASLGVERRRRAAWEQKFPELRQRPAAAA
jgi:hypothetical protein